MEKARRGLPPASLLLPVSGTAGTYLILPLHKFSPGVQALNGVHRILRGHLSPVTALWHVVSLLPPAAGSKKGPGQVRIWAGKALEGGGPGFVILRVIYSHGWGLELCFWNTIFYPLCSWSRNNLSCEGSQKAKACCPWSNTYLWPCGPLWPAVPIVPYSRCAPSCKLHLDLPGAAESICLF